ncbi:pyridoxamine 5'-phosphate oxidase family protein [Hephaestia sp. GCM10023244]|uniref:pyridoxamine 5'-phosphate oxidase family protein n=1 Tax=unclassified Hephaestia TaxID=2631281 RepID=UPI00207724DD|nr:pyridoxamine 5'-phosphate oxidase family protein [Hephaestia sp. MAHUQ-44]MCM8730432.1 pyridoxamine 5'-phosphate oxidase family protein [Hephaestia sp. MAHUQ-44]
MADFFDALTDEHRAFIAAQPMFFVASAAATGRINVSPKGMDTFRVLDASNVAYLDLGGSGNETQAHLAADGRITIMFCAFDNPALILRLYGHGVATLPQDAGFAARAAPFPRLPGVRQVFSIAVDSVMTSCGWGVPRMTLERERETLAKYHGQQDPVKRLARISGRTQSIDGLPLRVQTEIPAWDTRD